MEPPTGLLTEIAFGQEANAMRADPVVAGLAALIGGLRAELRDHARDDRGTRELLEVSCVAELDPYAWHLAWRLDRLRREHPDSAPGPADLFALGRAHARARLELLAPAIRSLLMRVTVRALDPEPHGAGWARSALRDLPRLRPADLPPNPERFPHLASLWTERLAPVPADWVPPWERPLLATP